MKKKLTVKEISVLEGVLSANEWRDRIYINIRGNGGNFAGERNSKLYVAADGSLVFQRGKGTVSSVWAENLKAVMAAYEAATE